MPEPIKPAALKEDGTVDMASVQKKWMDVIERHERKRQSWVQRSEKIIKLYADADTSTKNSAQRKYCVLWANVQTKQSTLYAKEPKCVVSRCYQTPNQDVRDAVIALERVANTQIKNGGLHAAILSARTDRLLPGRGTIWHRLETKDDGAKVTYQCVRTEFVGYKDYGHGEGRTWEEIDCTWRRTYMTKEKLEERFGPDVMQRCGVSLDYAEKDAPDGERQASVYELWCKSRNSVYWLARTAREALEVGEPPLKLKGFFPHPKPVFATLTNEHCIPTPDYVYYQDQAEEITRLTKRIDKLTDCLKLVGFYPAGPSEEGRSEIERALMPGVENKMIPVPSWAAFAEKGGAAQIQYLPVKDVAFIIESCVKLRQQLLQDVDQITGINDIQRGETNPNETLGAQELKSQYGQVRTKDAKDDFVRFAKEACEIIAEIAAENFTDEELGRLASMPHVAIDKATGQPVMVGGKPQPAGWIKLLRNQFAREVLVDVETDSTIHPDEDAEKQRRVEMFDAVNKGFAPLVQMQELQPQLAASLVPVWGDTMLFMIRGFRAGRELEETIEEAVEKIKSQSQAMAQKAEQAPPPQDPAIVKATLDAKAKEQQQQIDGQTKQVEAVEKGKVEALKVQTAHTENMAKFALQHRELDEEANRHQRELTHQSQLQDKERTFKGEQSEKDRTAKQQSEAMKAKPTGGEEDDDMRIEVKLSPEAEQQMLQQAMAGKQAKTQNDEASAQLMLQLPQLMMQGAQAQIEAAQALKEAAVVMKAPKEVQVVNGKKRSVPVFEDAAQ